MVALVLSQVAGLARSIIVARTFGASAEMDAFSYANRVSETLFLLVAGGALGSAFIPVFTGLLTKNNEDAAWKLASSLMNAVTLTLSLLAALTAFFAPQVVRYAIAPGIVNDPGLFSLTVSLLRIQLISAVLFGLGGLIVGILNAHQIFLIPALTASVYQLGIIFGAVVLAPSMGIYGLAWGVVIGSLFYLLIQLPSLFRQKGKYTFTLGLHDAHTRQVILLMGPRLLGVAVVQLNFWVNNNLASRMEEGSAASLTYGFSLMMTALSVIAQSVAIAAMPTFSAQHALGKLDEMRTSLAASLRGILMLTLPASIGMMILRVPLVSILYQRGEFSEHDVQLVSWALLWYAAGLVGHSSLEVLTRAFYAQHDTKTPVIVGTIAMILNAVFSILFSRYFETIGWYPFGGLALANSLATALEVSTLFIFIRRRLNGIEGRSIADGTWRFGLSGLGMTIGLLAWIQLTAGMNRWIIGLGGVALGAAIYFVGVVLLKVPEVKMMMNAIARRLPRRVSSSQ